MKQSIIVEEKPSYTFEMPKFNQSEDNGRIPQHILDEIIKNENNF